MLLHLASICMVLTTDHTLCSYQADLKSPFSIYGPLYLYSITAVVLRPPTTPHASYAISSTDCSKLLRASSLLSYARAMRSPELYTPSPRVFLVASYRPTHTLSYRWY